MFNLFLNSQLPTTDSIPHLHEHPLPTECLHVHAPPEESRDRHGRDWRESKHAVRSAEGSDSGADISIDCGCSHSEGGVQRVSSYHKDSLTHFHIFVSLCWME